MTFRFVCYFPGEDPQQVPIRIESDAWVWELLEAISTKLKVQLEGQEVNLKGLQLFKVNVFFLETTAN